MLKRKPVSLAVAIALAAVASAQAQEQPWRVVMGSDARVTLPGLPSGSRSFSSDDFSIGDVGQGLVGMRMLSPSAGYWAMRQGNWVQLAKLAVTGAMGPGRAGVEVDHVFKDLNADSAYAGPDGQRGFVARAGLPNDATGATWGVWRWDKSRNIEMARALTDGALGPGLGAGWVYQDSYNITVRQMNGGQSIINAYVTSPGGATPIYLGKAVPGQGVVGCALRNSTDPGLSPGQGEYFDTTWSMSGAVSVTTDNRVYLTTSTNQRAGTWEVCDGNPRARVLTGAPGVLGPDIGVATAVFTNLYPVQPGDGSQFAFFASFRPTSSDSSRTGLFWNDGSGNRALALNDAGNTHAPGWLGATWNGFSTDSLVSAGEWSAFQASVRTPENTTPSGLWRVKAGGAPELVALLGLTGQYGPEAGRTWDAFQASAVLANGDVVVHARTMPGSESAFWLLKRGAAPKRILRVGQTVSVPTTTGMQQIALSGYNYGSGAFPYGRGNDGWIGADGSMLLRATLTGFGSVLITTSLPNPIDKIFAYGFER